ncbi:MULTISPECIES: response regulator [unclassified Paenibacillus]|uniref:response regulator transcription factor n=1 Tax=unclassified Paenibacillus TaxID=185978 RepID=UPI0024055A8C|nr:MULTISPECIES: response regulator [unclassified Paenibacillus]MDF9841688.1 two-component system response regulator YesN [Paenibacillus sp. PastF-2]MDF9848200.1 two-component system response regulator YesN [Paenibacillus sp. PastM-2]MDF9854847.1 two-component system response regulator YesN [Paenibacillus sp. PastF-1]MDH6480117.1 two-component system response regulator YesN [Paenibacillus sp. PastH-2]MDH6507548.1 two-component system response regulator YesN [Paenibacillus sp. PastM-3]
MRKVLIVDDEPWVAYGISQLIDWESLGFQVIGEAYDGVSAWQRVLQEQPELVISDIRMPGLDGLELLEHIQKSGLSTQVVLISGYADFSYAQQAIRYGAFDYLLKQVEQDQLKDTAKRVGEYIDARKQPAAGELDLLLDELFELLDPDNRVTIAGFMENRQLSTRFPHFRFINCLFAEASTDWPALTSPAAAGHIQEARMRTGHNKLSILLMYDEDNYPLDLLTYISDYLQYAEWTGISSQGLPETPLARLHQEADIALFSSALYRTEQVLRYKPASPPADLRKTLLRLEVSIKERNMDDIAADTASIAAVCRSCLLPADQTAFVYNQIVSLYYKYCGSSWDSGPELLTYENIARQHCTLEELFARLASGFENAAGEPAVNPSGLAKRVLDYINESFTEDLLLSEVARNFRLSIGYASALVKRETGSTYTEYVAAKRLQLARQLLADPELSVHEIVQRTGYKDYFHFNKLFKKHFGVTPSKYRKL